MICLVLASIPLLDAVAWQTGVGAVGVSLVTLLDAATVRLVEVERPIAHVMKIISLLVSGLSLVVIGCSRQEAGKEQPQSSRVSRSSMASTQAYTNLPSAPSAAQPAAAAVIQGGDPIDLTRYYQTPASRFDQIEKYPWRDCPRGLQKFGNVPLAIGGMICLWGESNAKGGLVFPEQLQGIQVSRKFDAFYLYHTSFAHSPEGAPVAQLVFRYGDGTALTNEIRYGMHVRHWGWQQGEVAELNDPKSKMVWWGTNSTSRPDRPRLLRFFITEFPNPKQALEVTTIDLFSSKQKTASCILAMTTGPADLLRVEP